MRWEGQLLIAPSYAPPPSMPYVLVVFSFAYSKLFSSPYFPFLKFFPYPKLRGFPLFTAPFFIILFSLLCAPPPPPFAHFYAFDVPCGVVMVVVVLPDFAEGNAAAETNEAASIYQGSASPSPPLNIIWYDDCAMGFFTFIHVLSKLRCVYDISRSNGVQFSCLQGILAQPVMLARFVRRSTTPIFGF